MDTMITCNYKDFCLFMITPLHSSSSHFSFVLHTTQCSTDLYKFVISGMDAHRFPNQALASRNSHSRNMLNSIRAMKCVKQDEKHWEDDKDKPRS